MKKLDLDAIQRLYHEKCDSPEQFENPEKISSARSAFKTALALLMNASRPRLFALFQTFSITVDALVDAECEECFIQGFRCANELLNEEEDHVER